MTDVLAKSSCRILIVDDLAPVRQLLFHMLGALGFPDVRVAVDGNQAVADLTTRGVDLVLSDFQMDGLNGLQLLQRIRAGKLPVRRDLPVIMVTGHADGPLVDCAKVLDVNALLVKPFSTEALSKHVDHALGTSFALRPIDAYDRVQVPEMRDIAAPLPPLHDDNLALRSGQPAFLTAADLAAQRRAAPHPVGSSYAATSGGGSAAAVGASAAGNAAEAPLPPIQGAPHVFPIEVVRPGSRLAQDICNKAGRVLLSQGTVLNRKILDRLLELSKIEEELRFIVIYA